LPVYGYRSKRNECVARVGASNVFPQLAAVPLFSEYHRLVEHLFSFWFNGRSSNMLPAAYASCVNVKKMKVCRLSGKGIDKTR
jgi:hypothetical protein